MRVLWMFVLFAFETAVQHQAQVQPILYTYRFPVLKFMGPYCTFMGGIDRTLTTAKHH